MGAGYKLYSSDSLKLIERKVNEIDDNGDIMVCDEGLTLPATILLLSSLDVDNDNNEKVENIINYLKSLMLI